MKGDRPRAIMGGSMGSLNPNRTLKGVGPVRVSSGLSFLYKGNHMKVFNTHYIEVKVATQI